MKGDNNSSSDEIDIQRNLFVYNLKEDDDVDEENFDINQTVKDLIKRYMLKINLIYGLIEIQSMTIT